MSAVIAALAAITAGVTSLAAAGAVDASTWRFAPAQPPPPPAGAAPAPYPIPLGSVGEISFWAPNRGLMITGGAGVYAYDGVSWHQLATVCGGARGRIAWAGPDDFWTISDQRSGQLLAAREANPPLGSLSLCHFENGVVVGSYAMPLDEPSSYMPMDAAACFGPNDCWFGGQDGQVSNSGAFHLHWNGSEVTASYEPEDHAIADMVNFVGELYESVQIGAGDTFLPGENPKHPAVLHTIALAGQRSPCGEAGPFCEVSTYSEALEERLPEYGMEVSPTALQGFSLATDGSPLGSGATQLWAAASPVPGPYLPRNAKLASLTVLRYAGGVWSQILPNLAGGSAGLPGSSGLDGAESQLDAGASESGMSEAIAPEPGTDSAWLSLGGARGARVALLNADGTVSEAQELPLEAQEPEPVGERGGAGPIVCPATHDCWMATAGQGWLFHLSDGTPLAPDTDPFFDGQDGVITYRPPDGGVPPVYPDGFAEDDSLANQEPAPAPTGPPLQTAAPAKRVKSRPLLKHIKSRLLHHRVLVISFTLTARAHVQLVGRRRRRVVAHSPAESLKPGRHELSLALNPASWPTGVQFKATPIGASAPAGGKAGESESGDTVSL